jgi:hypothetical protein
MDFIFYIYVNGLIINDCNGFHFLYIRKWISLAKSTNCSLLYYNTFHDIDIYILYIYIYIYIYI